tara:strand:- start:768 stop:1007 length:240 start_codon:yes stop_codon:yes gene_type:complete
LFWQIGNLKEQFVEAGGLKASVARAWSEAEQTGRLLPWGATRLRSKAKRKSDWFRARQRTDKGSGFARLSDGAGAQEEP